MAPNKTPKPTTDGGKGPFPASQTEPLATDPIGSVAEDFLPLRSLRLRNDSQYLLTSGFDVGETVANGAHAGAKIQAIMATTIGFLLILSDGSQLVETGPGSGVVA